MIRIICAAIFLILFLVLSLPILLVYWIIGLISMKTKDWASLGIIKWAFSVLLVISGVKIDVIGRENIPKDRPVLYVANHRSIFDILINYVQMQEPTGYISKMEMRKAPILNLWMLNIGCLFLDRNDIKQGMKTILSAIDYVKMGRSIFIFPEGTRSKVEGEFGQFKAGSFKIAEKSGCDIIPVTIVNSGAIFEDHKPTIKKTHVIIEYGEPIHTSELSREDMKTINVRVQEQIMERYRINKEAI